ncbi:hypothetical protein ES707_17537 [subsurface metagenome]
MLPFYLGNLACCIIFSIPRICNCRCCRSYIVIKSALWLQRLCIRLFVLGSIPGTNKYLIFNFPAGSISTFFYGPCPIFWTSSIPCAPLDARQPTHNTCPIFSIICASTGFKSNLNIGNVGINYWIIFSSSTYC